MLSATNCNVLTGTHYTHIVELEIPRESDVKKRIGTLLVYMERALDGIPLPAFILILGLLVVTFSPILIVGIAMYAAFAYVRRCVRAHAQRVQPMPATCGGTPPNEFAYPWEGERT